MKAWRAATVSGALIALWPTTAPANPVKSEYTTIDLKHCKRVKRHAGFDAWTCRGLAGYPVYVAEADHRTFVSVGPGAEKRRAADQTLGASNTIFANGSRRTTLEWRFDRHREALVPYAVILRYFTQDSSARGEVLVVTKITSSQSCHVAYIDALAISEPIVLAHHIADNQARAHDCANAPAAVAPSSGKSPM